MLFRTIPLLLLTFCLAGCPLDNSDNGLSEAEINQLIAAGTADLRSQVDGNAQSVSDLETRVGSIETSVDNIRVGDRVSFGQDASAQRALSTAPSGSVGTLMQYSDANPAAAKGLSIKMDSGFVADFRMARDPSLGVITYLAETMFPVYESVDCGRTNGDVPFLEASRVGIQAQQQGLVVRLSDQNSLDPNLEKAANYWYFPGGISIETVLVRSRLGGEVQGQRDCQDLTTGEPAMLDVIRLQPNDPAVTGIPNEPWSGVPVISGN